MNLYDRVEAWLRTWAPEYYHRHAVIALALGMLAGVACWTGLVLAWQVNVVLLVAGAITRDIEKETGLHWFAWWWLLVPLLVAAASMALVSAWALGGAWFYSGRELRDRERIGTWDKPGLWWPVLASIGLHYLAVIFHPQC